MEGVVKLVTPVPPVIKLPAVVASYQSMVEFVAAVAESITVPAPHLSPLTGEVGAAGIAFTVATTAVLVAEMQPVIVFLA